MFSRCFKDDRRTSNDKITSVPVTLYLGLYPHYDEVETETAKVTLTSLSAVASRVNGYTRKLGSKCVIVVNYKLLVFTRSSSAPTCS